MQLSTKNKSMATQRLMVREAQHKRCTMAVASWPKSVRACVNISSVNPKVQENPLSTTTNTEGEGIRDCKLLFLGSSNC